jgi:zinc and cadmium transporter
MFQVVLFSLLGGVISLLAAIILINNRKTADGLAKYATPFAAGVLLAAAFTDLLPEAIHESTQEPRDVLIWALFGMLLFFMLERFLRFFHHHHEHGKEKANSTLVVAGDTLHNALDGIAIGAAFLISPSTGIVAALAVAAHEIPQEIGDFGLLLRNGMAKKRVIIINVLSALATTATAVLTFVIGDKSSLPVPALLAITAGFFIYIASSDIIPEIHETLKKGERDIRPWLLLFGAAFIFVVSPIAHSYIDAGHKHSEESHSDSHSAEEHRDFIVKAGEMAPEVRADAELDDSGLTVKLVLVNFSFTPDKEGEAPFLGEGHAHLYINGKKITRLYSEWTFVPKAILPDEFDSITVSLSNNDHSEYHLENGETIASVAQVEKHGHDEEGHGPESETMHSEDSQSHGD